MTAKEVFENLISTIEKSADENNEAVITNVELWSKSWRKEMETEVNNGVLDDVSKPVICQDWIHQDMLRMNYKFCSICGTKLESK